MSRSRPDALLSRTFDPLRTGSEKPQCAERLDWVHPYALSRTVAATPREEGLLMHRDESITRTPGKLLTKLSSLPNEASRSHYIDSHPRLVCPTVVEQIADA